MSSADQSNTADTAGSIASAPAPDTTPLFALAFTHSRSPLTFATHVRRTFGGHVPLPASKGARRHAQLHLHARTIEQAKQRLQREAVEPTAPQIGNARAIGAEIGADVVTIPTGDQARELGTGLTLEGWNWIRDRHRAHTITGCSANPHHSIAIASDPERVGRAGWSGAEAILPAVSAVLLWSAEDGASPERLTVQPSCETHLISPATIRGRAPASSRPAHGTRSA
jgi:hypothetical protein